MVIAVVLFVSGALSGGCGAKPCNGSLPSAGATHPELSSVRLIGSLSPATFPVIQTSDPDILYFAVDFADPGGDLGAGTMNVYTQSQQTPAAQSMVAVFAQSGLTADATQGTFWIELRFSGARMDGSRTDLSFQAVDAGGELSNCYETDLEFEVSKP